MKQRKTDEEQVPNNAIIQMVELKWEEDQTITVPAGTKKIFGLEIKKDHLFTYVFVDMDANDQEEEATKKIRIRGSYTNKPFRIEPDEITEYIGNTQFPLAAGNIHFFTSETRKNDYPILNIDGRKFQIQGGDQIIRKGKVHFLRSTRLQAQAIIPKEELIKVDLAALDLHTRQKGDTVYTFYRKHLK